MTDIAQGHAQAVVASAADNEVGETLARARAALGLSLEDCAQQIKFAPRKLEALEKGRYDELHGGAYARGMLRAYARLLKLDGNSLVALVAKQVHVPDTTDNAVSLRRPIPFVQPGKSGNLMYVVLSIGALVIVAWVGYGWLQERRGTAKLTFVPAAQAPLDSARVPLEKIKPAVGATMTPVIAPISQESVVEPKPAAPPPNADAPQPPKADAEVAATPAAGQRRIVMKFAGESWVEVRGRNGKTLHSQVNRPGTERVIDGEPPFTLVVGNARNVRMTYGDESVELAPHTKVDVARLTLP